MAQKRQKYESLSDEEDGVDRDEKTSDVPYGGQGRSPSEGRQGVEEEGAAEKEEEIRDDEYSDDFEKEEGDDEDSPEKVADNGGEVYDSEAFAKFSSSFKFTSHLFPQPRTPARPSFLDLSDQDRELQVDFDEELRPIQDDAFDDDAVIASPQKEPAPFPD